MSKKTETLDDGSLPKRYGTKSILAQSFATVAQSFLFVGMGMSVSIPAIVIRDLYKKTDDELSMTSNEASWYGSLMFVTYPIGSFSSGYLQGNVGKKRCMVMANVPGTLGWIFLYFASSSIHLFASTLLMGFGMGFGAGATSSYVGEISEPRLRGSLGSLGSTALRLGSLAVYVMAYFFDWRTVALSCTLCPVICSCMVSLIPESPVWLIARGKNEKAKDALCWLRGWTERETVNPEFVELVRYNAVSGTRRGDGVGGADDADGEGFFSKLARLNDPAVRKPLTLMMMYFFISFVSCLFPARPFLTDILRKVDLYVNQNESLVMLSVVTYAGSVVSTATVRRFGKRRLTLWTLSTNAVVLLLFGSYVLAVKRDWLRSLPWLVFTILGTVHFVGASGLSCISWMLLIEVFPNKSRGIATGTCSGLTYVLLFTLTKSYLSVETTLSLGYTMILFSSISFLGLIYLYFYLPETENKTLLEIEEFFASNKKGYET